MALLTRSALVSLLLLLLTATAFAQGTCNITVSQPGANGDRTVTVDMDGVTSGTVTVDPPGGNPETLGVGDGEKQYDLPKNETITITSSSGESYTITNEGSTLQIGHEPAHHEAEGPDLEVSS